MGKHRTVMQQHVDFWDTYGKHTTHSQLQGLTRLSKLRCVCGCVVLVYGRNQDGVISMWDTYIGTQPAPH